MVFFLHFDNIIDFFRFINDMVSTKPLSPDCQIIPEAILPSSLNVPASPPYPAFANPGVMIFGGQVYNTIKGK
jgi:hypothetical protein